MQGASMITRRQILNVIGPKGPSAVAEILHEIRLDSLEALRLVSGHVTDSRVVRDDAVSFVDVVSGLTLLRIDGGVWRVLPIQLVQRCDAVAAIAIVDAIPRMTGAELNRLHVSATGEHQSFNDTGALLTILAMDGLIEPKGIDTESWLFSAESSVNDPRQWRFKVVA